MKSDILLVSNKMDKPSKIDKDIQKRLFRRKMRLSTIIIWTIFIIIVVLSLRVGTQSQRINREIILMAAADQLDKDSHELTKSDYLILKELDLSSSMITDIGLLKKFPNLQKIDLSKTPIEVISLPKWKIMLAKLPFIKISSRKKINLSPLKKLHSLETLILRETNFQNLKSIAHLTNLKELNLRGTDVSDLEPLKELTYLQSLDLSLTEISDIRFLNNLKNLQGLEIRNTQVSNIEPIKGLINLRTLNLLGTPVKNLEPVKSLKNLQSLNIIACRYITNEQVADLQKSLPNLKIITRYGMSN